jgi:hypothetical protein
MKLKKNILKLPSYDHRKSFFKYQRGGASEAEWSSLLRDLHSKSKKSKESERMIMKKFTATGASILYLFTPAANSVT